jgi:hypothetical protein
VPRNRPRARLPVLVQGGSLTPSGGTPYDSGPITVPDTVTAVTTDDLQVAVIWLVNLTDEPQAVTITDGLGRSYLDQYPLAPRAVESLAFGGIRLSGGVRWAASQAGAVRGHITGVRG